ncbi:MAG: hypothetical protein IT431_10535 [Phycisphaerales bacterium]|nr:hypothetical protein [Phycisphaerales bacterium]
MSTTFRNTLAKAFATGIAVGLSCIAPAAARAQVSADEVESAILAAWTASTTPPDLKDLTVRWRLELLFVPDQGELNQLREAVRGHPDHPRVAELAGYEAALRGEPIKMGRHLLMRSAERWRYGSDPTQTEYIDVIVDGRNRWELTRSVLRILPGEGSTDDGRDPTFDLHLFWPELGRLLNGGFALGAQSGLVPQGASVSESGDWEFLASKGERPEEAFTARFTGAYDAPTRTVLPASMEYVELAAKPESVGKRTVFRGWQWRPLLGAWACDEVIQYLPDGKIDRRLVFESVDQNVTFDAAVAMPKDAGDDPLRGPVTFSSIIDYRANEIADVATGERARFVVQSERQAARSTVRWIGWTAAAAIIVVLGVIRLQRRLRSS